MLIAYWPTLAADSAALTSEQAKQRLANVKAAIQTLEKKLNQDKSKLSQSQQQLRTVELAISDSLVALKQLNADISHNSKQLNILQDRLHTLTQAQTVHTDLLAKQLRSAYVLGNEKGLKLIFNLDDPTRLARILMYLDYFNKHRSKLIGQLTHSIERKQSLERRIARQLTEQQKHRRERKDKQVQLEHELQQREQILVDLAQSIKAKGQKIHSLHQDEQLLIKLLADLRQALADIPSQIANIAQFHGKLPWPVSRGTVVSRFGRQHTNSLTKSNGIIIAAQRGQSVKSVHAGRVAYADWLRGFGLLLIIDHGDGYMTLYAHNRSLYKEVGDWVNTNDVIAGVGQSGGAKKVGLYFEIRHNGEPVNPLPWLKPMG